tara:strand:- start:883 stop:1050 length:168 start_codon:yes stop_codon:yes gene_type:complete
MIITLSLLLIASAIVVGLTYNGVFEDKDKDGIPDKVEEKFEEVKKKVKKRVTKKK